MVPLRLLLFCALFAFAGFCVGQDAPASKDKRETSDIATAYYEARIGRPCKLRLTPDVAVHALLALAISTVHQVDDRMVWALRGFADVGDRGLSGSRVATLYDRQAVCGAAYTPVWGDKRATELEVLVASRVGAGVSPWTGAPDDLHATGAGLWGKHGGVHVGLSPMPGGYADNSIALLAWRRRSRLDDIDAALDHGGVIGVLLFRCLGSDPKTEGALLRVLQHSQPWRRSPSSLWLRGVTPDPGPASFVGERAQWRAVHAAAKRLVQLNQRLRDGASSKLARRMRPRGVGISHLVVPWLERMMPLFAAAAEGRDVDAKLVRLLDSLFQPLVMLGYYLPPEHALSVAEKWDREFFSARMVAK